MGGDKTKKLASKKRVIAVGKKMGRQDTWHVIVSEWRYLAETAIGKS